MFERVFNSNINHKSDCFDCKERRIGCHSECESFLERKKQKEKRKQEEHNKLFIPTKRSKKLSESSILKTHKK